MVPGLYPSFGQDSYDDDADDHFLSFFLAAVIMIVLIYVLYHSKNKLGKMVSWKTQGGYSGFKPKTYGMGFRLSNDDGMILINV